MKLLSISCYEHEMTVKILNTVIYEKSSTEQGRITNILCGLIRAEKIKSRVSVRKAVYFCGIEIYKLIKDTTSKTQYLLNIKYSDKNNLDSFKDKFGKLVPKKHDDVYILNSNSGEAYLFLCYVTSYIAKNNSRKPLIIATKKYHLDLIEMLAPEIPFIYINKLMIIGNNFKMQSQRYFTIFPYDHFNKVDDDLNSMPLGEVHFFDYILKTLGLNRGDIVFNGIKINPDVEKSMFDKISATGLDLDSFIFLAPEAISCKKIDTGFWSRLCFELQAKGIDVFMNISDDAGLYADVKHCYLTFSEAFSLASKSKGMVMLRSGLSDMLSQTHVKKHIIYTEFLDSQKHVKIASDKVLAGFGFSKIPNIDKQQIKEYDFSRYTTDDLLQEILSDILRHDVFTHNSC